MATVHMICGRVGAGKTTYARTFASEGRHVLFVLDEWMANLFLMDAPRPMTLDWAMPRVERCERQIWRVCAPLIARGDDVVIEAGFFRREQRDRWRALAIEAGADVAVHAIDAPVEVRRQRVRDRNRGSATHTVDVDDATFDWAEAYFEPFGEDELRNAIVVAT